MKQAANVFQQRKSGSYFTNDPNGRRPEIAFVGLTFLFPSNTERLARESRSNDIHDATPRLAVKGAYVIPDRERRQVALLLPSKQDLSAVRIDFNRAHDAESK